ncbi:MAG TPA: helix-turn-helix transcriptional regulator [Terriglobales bacterium]|nr:helix-turn-helix transcriptional regulator [Terriglobales bacterium]
MSPREQLSAKEIQVATMVWEGKTNPEIAAVVGCTEQVIKNQLRSVFDKLGVWSRLELALYIASNGGASWVEQGSRPTAPENIEAATARSA